MPQKIHNILKIGHYTPKTLKRNPKLSHIKAKTESIPIVLHESESPHLENLEIETMAKENAPTRTSHSPPFPHLKHSSILTNDNTPNSPTNPQPLASFPSVALQIETRNVITQIDQALILSPNDPLLEPTNPLHCVDSTISVQNLILEPNDLIQTPTPILGKNTKKIVENHLKIENPI